MFGCPSDSMQIACALHTVWTFTLTWLVTLVCISHSAGVLVVIAVHLCSEQHSRKLIYHLQILSTHFLFMKVGIDKEICFALLVLFSLKKFLSLRDFFVFLHDMLFKIFRWAGHTYWSNAWMLQAWMETWTSGRGSHPSLIFWHHSLLRKKKLYICLTRLCAWELFKILFCAVKGSIWELKILTQTLHHRKYMTWKKKCMISILS